MTIRLISIIRDYRPVAIRMHQWRQSI